MDFKGKSARRRRGNFVLLLSISMDFEGKNACPRQKNLESRQLIFGQIWSGGVAPPPEWGVANR